MSKPTIDSSLDAILVQLGDFGKYQRYVFVLVCIPVILHSAVHVAYVFTAMDLSYRCEVPACDVEPAEYEPDWLTNAVPYINGAPDKCEMYVNNSTDTIDSSCSASDFDRDRTARCSSFVYKTNEKSILQEYNLHCSDTLWKLTLVGTINSFGQFSGLFIAGILSDRYGRRVVMVWGMVFCAICGFIRTAMPNYESFMVLEYFDAAFSSGTYICGFVLGVELVGPKNRALVGTTLASSNAIGTIFTSTAAWIVKSWRPLIYILYTPPFFLLSYFWIVPESIRWNIRKGRIEEAKTTLRKLAKVNGKEISESALDKINITKNEESTNESRQFFQALKSRILLLRFITCCFCWVTCTFVFYGLSLNSVSLISGNKYLNFILTALIEIPAYFLCNIFLGYFGRRKSICGFYALTAAACIGFVFIPSNAVAGSLSTYLIGKFGATAAFTSVYVLTSEMFPTIMRHSFMGACSTFARVGVMVAPQMPLLENIWSPLPMVCFAGMALIAGCLTLLFPETLNVKLPDTIVEAENISKLYRTNYVENDLPQVKEQK